MQIAPYKMALGSPIRGFLRFRTVALQQVTIDGPRNQP